MAAPVTRAQAIAALSAFACAGVARVGWADDARDIPLLDQDGRPFTLRGAGGLAAAVTFVATRCTDSCPIAEAVFARVAESIRKERLDARLVVVTLDPHFDTPFVMARTARDLGARAPAFRLASGNPEDVSRLMRAFGVVAHPDAHGVPETHSDFIYVLDNRARLARTLLLSTGSPREIVDALRARVRKPVA